MYKTRLIYPEDQLPLETIGNVTFMPSDVSNLLNQRRLDLLGLDTARDYIERMSPHLSSSPQLDDETLMRSIRSRHIQSLSELRSYIDSIDSTMQDAINQHKNQADNNNVDKVDKNSDTHL